MGRKNNGAAAAIAGVSFRSGKESRAIKIRAAQGIFAKNAAPRLENAGGVLNIIIKPTGHLCTVGFVYRICGLKTHIKNYMESTFARL